MDLENPFGWLQRELDKFVEDILETKKEDNMAGPQGGVSTNMSAPRGVSSTKGGVIT